MTPENQRQQVLDQLQAVETIKDAEKKAKELLAEAVLTATEFRNDQQKEVMKEALKEWMDDKFASFGRWSLSTLAILLLGALTYFILWANGWHK